MKRFENHFIQISFGVEIVEVAAFGCILGSVISSTACISYCSDVDNHRITSARVPRC